MFNCILSLIKHRNKYFKNNNVNILDKSPFQDLVIKCIGKSISINISSGLNKANRAKKNLKILFEYRPENKKNILNGDFAFMKMNGLEEKNWILDINKIKQKQKQNKKQNGLNLM